MAWLPGIEALRLTGSESLARRYLVVNAFDGVLTMLGMNIGFWVDGSVTAESGARACLAASLGLGMSGLSSAYVSEDAEKGQELHELERAMARSLDGSVHGEARRAAPIFIALVNGGSPMVASLVVIAPLWAASSGLAVPGGPFAGAVGVAFAELFALGLLLGQVGRTHWLLSGLRAVLVGVVTVALVWWVGA